MQLGIPIDKKKKARDSPLFVVGRGCSEVPSLFFCKTTHNKIPPCQQQL